MTSQAVTSFMLLTAHFRPRYSEWTKKLTNSHLHDNNFGQTCSSEIASAADLSDHHEYIPLSEHSSIFLQRGSLFTAFFYPAATMPPRYFKNDAPLASRGEDIMNTVAQYEILIELSRSRETAHCISHATCNTVTAGRRSRWRWSLLWSDQCRLPIPRPTTAILGFTD